MPAATYLARTRSGLYLFRAVIPKHLRNQFDGRTAIRQSLKTHHRPTALKRARKLAVAAEELLSMASRTFRSDLTIFANGALEITASEVEELGINKVKELRQMALENAATSSSPSAPVDPTPTGPKISETMNEYVDCKRSDKKKLASLKKGPQGFRWGGYTAYLKLFLAVTGDKSASEINTDDLRRFKQLVPQLPMGNAKGASELLKYDYENLRFYNSLTTITQETAKRKLKRLSQSTIGDYYSCIVAFIRWLTCENDYLREGMAPKAGAILSELKIPDTMDNQMEQSYDRFNIRQLGEIFSSPQFDTSKPYKRHANRSPLTPADFWLPLLALYSGARGRELAQLHTNDIVLEYGVWCLDINKDSEDKQLKSKHSIRLTPIHKKLIEQGFLDFHKEQQHKGEKHLFPELRRTATGKLNPYKKWGDKFRPRVLKRHVKLESEKQKLAFHSFRSTFVTELKHQGVNPELRKEIVGHSDGNSVHDTYSKEHLMNLLKDEVDKATYPGLDLPHISWSLFRAERLKR